MSKILLLSQEYVGKSMAGPGIRYFEFAKALSKGHEVTLMIPNEPDISHPEFKILKNTQPLLKETIQKSDVLISQLISPRTAFYAKRAGVKIILDAYDPMPIENLELFKFHPESTRNFQNTHILKVFQFSFHMADAVISGSSKQRDLWMGFLMNQGKINPQIYDSDNSLNRLIDVVPFGMSSEMPKRVGESIRSRFGIPEEGHIILWGGGVWNWFDPLTLIKAVADTPNAYLVFMGLKPPNPHIPEMKMSQDAVELAKELNLYDKKVFFNFGWTSYEERQNFLLDASIGASLHFEHLETQYSFRTRILDYLWAGLPIIGTEGDYFAELIKKHHLGIVVPQNDVEAVRQAIVNIIENGAAIKENITKIRPAFYWEKVVGPIHNMIQHFSKEPKSDLSIKDIAVLSKFYAYKYHPITLLRYLKRALIK